FWGVIMFIEILEVVAILFTFIASLSVPAALGQTRRKKINYPVLAINIAIMAGDTAAGALIGGRKGAAIGAGAGLLYASSRRGTKRRAYISKYRCAAKVAGGSLVGVGVGAWAGGKKGAIISGLAGAGATYLYTKNGNRYYRARNGQRYYTRNGRTYYAR